MQANYKNQVSNCLEMQLMWEQSRGCVTKEYRNFWMVGDIFMCIYMSYTEFHDLNVPFIKK
jgi:hypothetical protein